MIVFKLIHFQTQKNLIQWHQSIQFSGSKFEIPFTEHSMGQMLVSIGQASMDASTEPLFSVPSIFVALADSRWLLEFSDHIFRFNPLKMEKEEIKGQGSSDIELCPSEPSD